MKRFTPTEWGALILSAMPNVAGLIWLCWPREMNVSCPTNDIVGSTDGFTGVGSKGGSRLYGAAAIIVDVGLATLDEYRGKTRVAVDPKLEGWATAICACWGRG